jgi:RimJ/RimL family protein N-acetyltransferase
MTTAFLHDADQRVGDWVLARIPHETSWGDWYHAIGYESDGEIVAAAVFTRYTGHDVHISAAIDGPLGPMAIECFRRAFRYAFDACKCRRVTAHIGANNAPSLALARKLGFKHEGTLRDALPDQDVLVMGLLRSECPFLEVT